MYTIENILELDPCEEYTREKLEELWEGKESLALREILELTIPIDDRNWVMPRLVPNSVVVVKWAHLCAVAAATAARSATNAARSTNRADKSAAATAARYAAEYAGYAAEYAGYAARSTAEYAAEYAGYAARSAANAARYAGSAAGYAADHAADATGYAAANAESAALSACSGNRDTELYRLLTVLCDMEERCTQ